MTLSEKPRCPSFQLSVKVGGGEVMGRAVDVVAGRIRRVNLRVCACACLGVYAAGLCARKHFSHARVELQGMSVALDRAVCYHCGGIAGRIRVRGDCLSRARRH